MRSWWVLRNAPLHSVAMRRQAEKTHLSSHANLHIFKEMPKRSGISRWFSLRGSRQSLLLHGYSTFDYLFSTFGGEVLYEKTCLCRKKRRPPYESGGRRFKSLIPNIISFVQNQTNDDLFSFTRRMNFRNFGAVLGASWGKNQRRRVQSVANRQAPRPPREV